MVAAPAGDGEVRPLPGHHEPMDQLTKENMMDSINMRRGMNIRDVTIITRLDGITAVFVYPRTEDVEQNDPIDKNNVRCHHSITSSSRERIANLFNKSRPDGAFLSAKSTIVSYDFVTRAWWEK